MLSAHRRAAARHLLDELESHQLHVVLVPQKTFTNHGGMIRVAAERNCDWYRRFCLEHPSSRRRRKAAPDTAIKRAHTLRTLRRLAAGIDDRTGYSRRLLALLDRVDFSETALPFSAAAPGAPDNSWREAFA